MAILIKKSEGMKAKIQMRMLGGVTILYLMLILSGLFTSKTRKVNLNISKDSLAFAKIELPENII